MNNPTIILNTESWRTRHAVWRISRSLAVACTLLAWPLACPAEVGQHVDFTYEVRPILSDRCFGCHGPGKAEADLRLDLFEGATEWAVVPGNPNESELIARVINTDHDVMMPPPESGKPRLTPEEVEVLRAWIAGGAKYTGHWAFEPICRPNDYDDLGTAAAIDAIVEERLNREGLSPQSGADRLTVLRRVTLDLTGLPPSPAEAEAFLVDVSPSAYERVVDRLLNSPRYGEHRARYWLDAVRYADTHGLHLDNYREVWPYRDWVIRSFNDNVPFDRFLIEQLAGDLLPRPGTDQLVASGFNRLHVTTGEGGSIVKEYEARNGFERTDAFGSVVLGLTIGCAKCHDHKYDPVTQRDYYSLFAFFNNLEGSALDHNRRDHRPVIRVPSVEQAKELRAATAASEQAQAALTVKNDTLDALQRDWEASLLAAAKSADLRAGVWQTMGPREKSEFEIQVSKISIESEFGPRIKPDLKATFTEADGKVRRWKPLPELVEGRRYAIDAGRTSVNYFLRRFTAVAATELVLTTTLADDERVWIYLNGESLERNERKDLPEDGRVLVTLPLVEGENELLIRVSNLEGTAAVRFDFDREIALIEAAEIAAIPPADRTVEQMGLMRRLFRSRSDTPDARALVSDLVEAQQAIVGLRREIPTTPVSRERRRIRPARVLERGEYDQPGEEAPRATPGFLPPLPASETPNRLALAKWAVSPDHPLTARVTVNRVWQQFFGTGLVVTVDDFGSQAAPPSHPELLDLLAADFISGGWDLKKLVREIVMSNAYRRNSAAPAALWEADPANRLLARGPRFRLDAETLRDQALYISDRLFERLGGPSVRPPQPEGLWKSVAFTSSNTAKFVADEGPDKTHRRSLYTFYKRTSPPPQMVIADGPSRESCTLRRERTNTPLQALMLMNDPQYFEAAAGLAQCVLNECGGDERAASQRMFLRATGRPATEDEIKNLVAARREQLAHYEQNEEAASRLVTGVLGEPGDRPAETASWIMLANLIINLDEVVTKN